MYDVISILRILSMRASQPERWKVFWKLMSHLDDWLSTGDFEASHKNVVDYVLDNFQSFGANRQLLYTIFGICYTNDFSVRVQSVLNPSKPASRVRLCYPLTAMLSHDCMCNTSRYILDLKDDFVVVLKAMKCIKRGDIITLNYVDIMVPTIIRNEILMKDKWFKCKCKRCADPTECNTFGSGLMCTKNCDKDGVMLPTENGNWKCKKCGNSKPEKSVKKLFKEIYDQSENMINSVPNVRIFEKFLEKYEGKILHANHMTLTNLKYSLCGFYGRIQGYTMNEMTEKMILRKRQLCEEILAVLNKVDLGISPRKGTNFPLFFFAESSKFM